MYAHDDQILEDGEEMDDFDQANHNPDCRLLLWPELGFITVHDPKFKSSLKRLEVLMPEKKLSVYEEMWYVNVLHQMNDKKSREIFIEVLRYPNPIKLF
jgi:hypothetical protein